MTREEILSLNDVRPYNFETENEKKWYEIGCIDGLDAADAEPDTSELWHPVEEEPEENRYILTCEETNRYNSIKWYGTGLTWKSVAKIYEVKRWAYIDDLIPKGGDK